MCGKEKLSLLERQPHFLWVEVVLSQGSFTLRVTESAPPLVLPSVQSMSKDPAKEG